MIKHLKQKMVAVGATVAAMAVPSVAMANTSIDATKLTEGITAAGPIIVAVGGAVFVLVGLVVCIRYAKRAAN